MAVEVLDYIPKEIRSGDTVRFTVGYSDCPASAWSASLIIATRGAAPLTIAATESGDNYIFVITAAQTAALSAGVHEYAIRCTETATNEVQTVETGTVRLLLNLGATNAKSTAALQLDLANTALSTLLSYTNSTVSFNGQSFTKENQQVLIDIVSRLKAQVALEDVSDGYRTGPSRTIYPNFVS